MKKSVCMAAYNGQKYIAAQIESILPQLEPGDELIVSDDAPGGETERIVRFYGSFDSRVKYAEGEGRGVVKNFENALKRAEGQIIFLCDQDDVWLGGKAARVMEELSSGARLVLHDAKVTDENLNVTVESFFAQHGSRPGFTRNLLRNSYMGCCMAFTRGLLEKALPFPEKIPMHDQWIGLIGELNGGQRFIEEPLILYRRHGGTVTGERASGVQKVVWRARLIKHLFELIIEN